MTAPQQGMVPAHQPGQDVFKSVLPEDIDWKPFAAFPPSVRLAVVVGDPSQAGPYTIRVRLPHGVKLMPHRHPEDRVYTVISGIFFIGLGDEFDEDKLESYPPGSVVVLPGNTSHFHWAKSSRRGVEIRGTVGNARRESGNGISVLIPREPGRTGAREGIEIRTGRANERQGIEEAGREL
jgi:quercetin dioxygenase-like cupin family protein